MLPLFIILLIILTAAGVFFSRPPVLVVTDASFYQIYGSRRFTLALARNSLQLFRRVIPVPVSETAGPDILSLVVESAAETPYAVIFPRRYLEGARHYTVNRPQVPVFVMWGRGPLLPFAQYEGLIFVRTDTAADLFRAGLAAAVLTEQEYGVLFFTDGNLHEPYLEAFGQGLYAQGFSDDPIHLDSDLDHVSYSNIGCVVVAGAAVRFLERDLEIPVILFSWIDPILTPRSVRIVFDDSPLALISAALRAVPPDSYQIRVPSRATVISARTEARREFRELRGLISGNLQNK